MNEEIEIYLVGRRNPISFCGEYIGHKRPDGTETKNWHYYKDKDGIWYHFRKEQIQLVKSREITT